MKSERCQGLVAPHGAPSPILRCGVIEDFEEGHHLKFCKAPRGCCVECGLQGTKVEARRSVRSHSSVQA